MRDAAIELIGKYVQQIPELADDYYARIADRIAVSCAVFHHEALTESKYRTLASVFESESSA